MSEHACGYEWEAPFLLPPNAPNEVVIGGGAGLGVERVPVRRLTRRKQVCVLPKGHDGGHRSSTNVTAEGADPGGR